MNTSKEIMGIHRAIHPAFDGISNTAIALLAQYGKELEFTIGESVVNTEKSSNYTYIIKNGTVRFLGRFGNKTKTIYKGGENTFVGLCSLLNTIPCEEVIASTDCRALRIPNGLMVEIYKNENTFRKWHEQTIFVSEIDSIASLHPVLERHKEEHILSYLSELEKYCAVLSKSDFNEVRSSMVNYQYFVLSDNCLDYSFGQTFDAQSSNWPKTRGIFGPRIVGIEKTFLELLSENHYESSRRSSVTVEATLPRMTDDQSNISYMEEVKKNTDEEKGPDNSWYPLNIDDLGYKPSRFKLIRAADELGSVAACCKMIAAELDIAYRKDSIEKILKDEIARGKSLDLQLCGNILTFMGLHVRGYKTKASAGTRLEKNGLVSWRNSFAVIKDSNDTALTLASPLEGLIEISIADLTEEFPNGINILRAEINNLTPRNEFGWGWLKPSLIKYKNTLIQVLLASLTVQVFGLANPLLVQVIIDKVINQRSLDTLQVLGFALIIVTIFEAVISSLRTFLLTDTANRIDMKLGSEIIDHLIKLPLSYFDKKPVGELSSRIAELEKIRSFVTGQGLFTIIDAFLSIIYITIMIVYSWLLTLISLAVIPVQILISIIGAPLFRRQSREAAQLNAKTQSHLVEIMSGIQTVKSQNIEMIARWKWQDYFANYMSATFAKVYTATLLSQSSQTLQKLSQLLVLWVGAGLVLDGTLSLGQLIAFRIISGYVTQPILRLSSLWQSIQELKVSFERLADIIDTEVESNESDNNNLPMPGIIGDIEFDSVSFGFHPSQRNILQNINLTIKAGSNICIVGESGSGKSTLTKLISRLYAVTDGRILIDKYDISKMELYSIRRQIGVVPQEPLLFSGTIIENISIASPNASYMRIERAAKIACAHDFIMKLPNGYSSEVGERGSNLSGGQRQRIAIARTILMSPKLLILDEATSALDQNTETNVLNNIKEEFKEETVIFITHRLSSAKNADQLIVMNQGRVEEVGSHEELLSLQGVYYATIQRKNSAHA